MGMTLLQYEYVYVKLNGLLNGIFHHMCRTSKVSQEYGKICVSAEPPVLNKIYHTKNIGKMFPHCAYACVQPNISVPGMISHTHHTSKVFHSYECVCEDLQMPAD